MKTLEEMTDAELRSVIGRANALLSQRERQRNEEFRQVVARVEREERRRIMTEPAPAMTW
jgi:hypothetical protein